MSTRGRSPTRGRTASTARGEAVRAREELAAVRADAKRQSLEAAELRTTVAEAQRLVAEARGETARVAAQVAAAAAQRDAAVQKAVEQAADREALLNQFKVLSAESLERQTRQVDAVAEQRLKATEQLVAPLTDGLRQMQEKLQLVELERAKMAAELGEQVATMQRSGEAIRRETLQPVQRAAHPAGARRLG